MSRNEIIELLYSNNVVRRYGSSVLQRYSEYDRSDIESEVWLNICSIPDGVLEDLMNNQGIEHLTAYIRRFVMNQLSPQGRTRDLQRMLNENNLDIEMKDSNGR